MPVTSKQGRAEEASAVSGQKSLPPREPLKTPPRPEVFPSLPSPFSDLRVDGIFTPVSEVKSFVDSPDGVAFIDPKFAGSPLPPCLGRVSGWVRAAERHCFEATLQNYSTEAAAFAQSEGAGLVAGGISVGAENAASVSGSRRAKGGGMRGGGGGVNQKNKETTQATAAVGLSESCVSLIRRSRDNLAASASSNGRRSEGSAFRMDGNAPSSSSSSPSGLAAELRGRLGEDRLLAQSEIDFESDGGTGPLVVGLRSHRLRHVRLIDDENESSFARWVRSVFGFVAELAPLIRSGFFLWELISPQTDSGYPLFNPRGHYCVSLFIEGSWRVVEVDDLVPVEASIEEESSCVARRRLFPESRDPREVWPLILTKALLKVFRNQLLSEMTPAAVEALTGRVEVRLPLRLDLLEGCLTRGLWPCLSLAPSSSRTSKDALESGEVFDPASCEKKESLALPFLVASVDASDRSVRVLNSQTSLPPQLVGEEVALEENVALVRDEDLPLDSTKDSKASEPGDPYATDYSGVVSLTSDLHPDCQKARLREETSEKKRLRLGVSFDPRGRILIRRPFCKVLDLIRCSSSAAGIADVSSSPSSSLTVAEEELSLEFEGSESNPRCLKEPSSPSSSSPSSSSPSSSPKAAVSLDVSLPPQSPRSFQSADNAQQQSSSSSTLRSPTSPNSRAREDATAAAAKAGRLSEFLKPRTPPWLSGLAVLPCEGIAFSGGSRVDWNRLLKETQGFFSVFIFDKAMDGVGLHDLFCYEKVVTPLPLRAAVFVVNVNSKDAAAIHVPDTSETNHADKKRTGSAGSAGSGSGGSGSASVSGSVSGSGSGSGGGVDCESEKKRKIGRTPLSPHALFWKVESGMPVAIGQSHSTEDPLKTFCQLINLDAILPRWRNKAPQLRFFKETLQSRFSVAAGLLGVEEPNASIAGWISVQDTAQKSVQLRCTDRCCEAEECLNGETESCASNSWVFRRLEEAVSADVSSVRLGRAKSKIEKIRLTRGVASFVLSDASRLSLMDVSEGLFAYLAVVEAPATLAPLRLRWRSSSPSAAGLADSSFRALDAATVPLASRDVAQQGKGPTSSKKEHVASSSIEGISGTGTSSQAPCVSAFTFANGSSSVSASTIPMEEFLATHLGYSVQTLEVHAAERWSLGSYNVWLKAEMTCIWNFAAERLVDDSPHFLVLPQLPHAGLFPLVKLSLVPVSIETSSEPPVADPASNALAFPSNEGGGEGSRLTEFVGGSALQRLPLLPFLKIPVEVPPFAAETEEEKASKGFSPFLKMRCLMLIEAEVPLPARSVFFPVSVAVPSSASFCALKVSSVSTSVNQSWRGISPFGGVDGPPLGLGSLRSSSAEDRAESTSPTQSRLRCCSCVKCIQKECQCQGDGVWILSEKLQVRGGSLTPVSLTARLTLKTEEEEQLKELRLKAELLHQTETLTATASPSPNKGDSASSKLQGSLGNAASKLPRRTVETTPSNATAIVSAPLMQNELLLLSETARGNAVEIAHATLLPGCIYILRLARLPASAAGSRKDRREQSSSHDGAGACSCLCGEAEWTLEVWSSGELVLSPDSRRSEFESAWIASASAGDSSRPQKARLSRLCFLEKRNCISSSLDTSCEREEVPSTVEDCSSSLLSSSCPAPLCGLSISSFKQLVLWKLRLTPEELFDALAAEQSECTDRKAVACRLSEAEAEDSSVSWSEVTIDADAFAESKLLLASLDVPPSALRRFFLEELEASVSTTNPARSVGRLSRLAFVSVFTSAGLACCLRGAGEENPSQMNSASASGAGKRTSDKKSRTNAGSGAAATADKAAANRLPNAPLSKAQPATFAAKAKEETRKERRNSQSAGDNFGSERFCVTDGLMFPFKASDFVNEDLRTFATPLAGDFARRVCVSPLCPSSPAESIEMTPVLSSEEAERFFFLSERKTTDSNRTDAAPQTRKDSALNVSFAFSSRSLTSQAAKEALCVEGLDTGEEEASAEVLWNAETEAFAAFIGQRKDCVLEPLLNSASPSPATSETQNLNNAPSQNSECLSLARRESLAARREALRHLHQRRIQTAIRAEEFFATLETAAREPSREDAERLLSEGEETGLAKSYPAVYERLSAQFRLSGLLASLQELVERLGAPPTPHRREDGPKKLTAFRKKTERDPALVEATAPPSTTPPDSETLSCLSGWLVEAERLLTNADPQRRPVLGSKGQATLELARELSTQKKMSSS